MNILSKIIFIALLILLIMIGGKYSAEQYEKEKAAIKRQDLQSQELKKAATEKDQIGLLAEKSAELIIKASHECKRIGYQSLEECREHQSILPTERKIASLANETDNSISTYYAICDKHYRHEECLELLWRAHKLKEKK